MKLLLLCLLMIQPPAFAELDTYSAQGLKKTQEFLRNKQERQKFIDKNAAAKNVDDKVTALAGSEQTKEQVYDLAAKVMANITKETNGDPAKMQKLLDEAQKDPKSFYKKYFNVDEKGQVHDIADKIGQQHAQVPSGN